jgi:HK97 family phage major capsid protein
LRFIDFHPFVSQLTAGLHAVVDPFHVQRLANAKVKRLEKENAELKAELDSARLQKEELEGRIEQQAKAAAEKEKALASEAEARAAADAKTIQDLRADVSAAEKRAVDNFLSSQDFADRQLDFASLWVLDTVSQCLRLCKEKLGAGDYGFLIPSEIARVVEARRKEGAEITLASGDSSEEERDEPAATADGPDAASVPDPDVSPAHSPVA